LREDGGMQCTNYQSGFKYPTGKLATRGKLVDVIRGRILEGRGVDCQ
jgi:hypothetical protein